MQYNPVRTEYFVVEGANHRQFGDYGEQQPFDVDATISRGQQQNEAAAAVVDFYTRWARKLRRLFWYTGLAMLG